MKRIMISSLLAAALSCLIAQPAMASEPSNRACPLGWDPGPVTLEEFLGLERIQAGLDAGLYTVEGVEADFAETDENGDTYICVLDVPRSGSTPNPASGWQYVYFIEDNNFGPPAEA